MLLVCTNAQAQCLAPMAEADKAVTDAANQVAAVALQTTQAQALVNKRLSLVEKEVARLSSRTVADLSAAQSSYRAAAQQLQNLTIPRVEADRVLRGARQRRSEAASSYRVQADALLNAVERARRGEVTPSLTDALSCADGDCSPIDARTHAAMITIGAVAQTVQSEAWPTPGRECDFVLLPPSFAVERKVLRLGTTQTEPIRNSSTVRLARQQYDTALKDRDSAIEAVQDGSDAAIQKLKALNSTITALGGKLQEAETALAKSQAKERDGRETLSQHLNYWDQLAIAVTAASLKEPTPQQEVSDSKSATLKANDLEAAAFAVMGANPPGKAKACLLKVGLGRQNRGQEKTVAFAPVPPAKC